jgi:hypothetical protein
MQGSSSTSSLMSQLANTVSNTNSFISRRLKSHIRVSPYQSEFNEYSGKISIPLQRRGDQTEPSSRLESAGEFIQMITDPVCLVNSKGNILNRNQAFSETVQCSMSIYEVLPSCLEQDRVVSALKLVCASNSHALCLLSILTRSTAYGIEMSESFEWHFSPSTDGSFTMITLK